MLPAPVDWLTASRKWAEQHMTRPRAHLTQHSAKGTETRLELSLSLFLPVFVSLSLSPPLPLCLAPVQQVKFSGLRWEGKHLGRDLTRAHPPDRLLI